MPYPAAMSEFELDPRLAADTSLVADWPLSRVLLMDDELTVRDVCGRMLRSLGHQVAFAIDGEQALELYAHALAKKHPFDLVIMDLTVPGAMGGREATRRLIELDPDVQVVVSSGYSNDPIMADCESHGFRRAVQKPFLVRDLGEALSEVLGDR